MSEIVLARIDDRLIHGQVMTAWVQYSGGKEIIIVDDKIAQDKFLSTVISGAAPKYLTTKILGVEDTINYLQSKEDIPDKIIILAKEPKTFFKLISNGIKIDRINLGGMGSNQKRKKFYKNISVSSDEKEVLEKILNEGVDVYIQVVPNTESVDIRKILKRRE